MTEAISLRDVQDGDLPVFFEQQRDRDATRMAAFPSRDYDEFMAHWAKCRAEKSSILKTIVFQGGIAGNIVSWEVAGDRNIGYWLGKEYWGKGIATAALAHFLEQVKARPLVAHVAKANVASIRVLQKCGFMISGESSFQGIDGKSGSELTMKLDTPA